MSEAQALTLVACMSDYLLSGCVKTLICDFVCKNVEFYSNMSSFVNKS